SLVLRWKRNGETHRNHHRSSTQITTDRSYTDQNHHRSSKPPPIFHRSFFHDYLQRFRRNVVSRAAELKQVKGCLVFQEQFFVNKSLSRKSGELGALGVMITEHLCVVLSCAVFLW
ncbi:unnamed protein product, partial [Brassica rapa subsp. trilocularis]